jgi:DNA processing protein
MGVAEELGLKSHEREWLALSLTPGLGHTRTRRLLQHFSGVRLIFRASLTELEAAQLPASSAQSIAMGASYQLADAELRKVAATPGVRLLGLDSPEYPEHLKQIYDPPLVLYVRGNAEVLSQPGIAMVGTRHPTPYGLGMAERLACDLAARGLIIFSGLARGVDSSSHRGAVKVNGKTVGVLGTGVDVIYPRENRKLADSIIESGGAIISEFGLGTAPTPQNFPIRNRIISGLSYGVLVVEAGEYSGTRITARCALEQCREIFAVPGNVTNRNSWGPNTLIKQGAKLVATWEDVMEELPSDLRMRLNPVEVGTHPETGSLFPEADGKSKGDAAELPNAQKKLFALIKADESIHIDTLMEKLEPAVSSSEVFTALFELEMSGRIRQLPGKCYVRVF